MSCATGPSSNCVLSKPHQARKRFGQHFLVDQSVIHAIVEAINPQPQEVIWEIGPGQAALTRALLERIPTLHAIEIDRDLIKRLRAEFGNRLALLEGDALSIDYSALATSMPIRVVGNLPYNISSPLLIHLLAARDRVTDQVFMLQKEVVERIVAPAGSTHYGRLSVMLQAVWQCDHLFDVAPEAFDPPPAVMSAIVRLGAGPDWLETATLVQLERLLAVAFGQRRKMLRNTLLPWLETLGADPSVLNSLDPTVRPQDVAVADYLALARYLAQSLMPGIKPVGQ